MYPWSLFRTNPGLRPQVDSISGGGVDVSPLQRDVEQLEKQATSLQISAEQNTARARDAQTKAVKVGQGAEWAGRGSRGGLAD